MSLNGEILDADLGQHSEEVGSGARKMKPGGNQYMILMAKFNLNCASFFFNPETTLEEVGYGRRVNADGYTRDQQEYVDSMF